MIPCPKCKDAYLLPVTEDTHFTMCPKCEHVWELNEMHTAVKSVTVELHGMNQATTNEGVIK